MNRIVKLLIISVFFSTIIFAQGTAGTNAKFEYRSLIDIQTAGILEKGYVGVGIDVMPKGVVISGIEVGVFNNFSFGISYGAVNVIGSGNVDFYPLPGVYAKARVVDEVEMMPAIAIGFDSQGKGEYYDGLNRYQIKSPGFFVAASKNYELLGYFSIHAMLNFTLERDDNDKDLNFAIGAEKTIGSKVSFYAEYDFALNDNNPLSLGDGKGYLNMGLRWSVAEGFTLGLDLHDLLSNQKINTFSADRALFVEYIAPIF
ncbi:MAG: hypothetical protein KKF62_08385 [Bacteroidetes bacterium]|nr:hypothetical protein [Bacteroidota bacterium]MBU1113638.1 hypothetical protein [Bacteroidota bacterium]MBU1796786.1 hypothetical protein [Bacteroidota bacterium]